MFHFEFECKSKEIITSKIQQHIENESYDKGIFGNKLYKENIHFANLGDEFLGFFIESDENEGSRGMPIRVSFSCKIFEKDGMQFMKGCIYPNVFQLLFLIFAVLFLLFFGKSVGFIVSVVLFIVFGKGYYDLTNKCLLEIQTMFMK